MPPRTRSSEAVNWDASQGLCFLLSAASHVFSCGYVVLQVDRSITRSPSTGACSTKFVVELMRLRGHVARAPYQIITPRGAGTSKVSCIW